MKNYLCLHFSSRLVAAHLQSPPLSLKRRAPSVHFTGDKSCLDQTKRGPSRFFVNVISISDNHCYEKGISEDFGARSQGTNNIFFKFCM